MKLKKEFIRFLRQYRHDWLNHLQVIKAYASMDKKDELSRFIDQLIINAHEEARISRLGDVELSYFLLTYNWTQDKLQLDVELEIDEHEQIDQIGPRYPYLLNWIKQLTQSMENIALVGEENRLLLLLSYLDRQLTICVDFIGTWDEEQGMLEIKRLEELVTKDQGKLKLNQHIKGQLSFEMVAQKELHKLQHQD